MLCVKECLLAREKWSVSDGFRHILSGTFSNYTRQRYHVHALLIASNVIVPLNQKV